VLFLYLGKVYVFVFTAVSFCVHALKEHQTVVITSAKRMHACKHTHIYICDYMTFSESEYLFWGEADGISFHYVLAGGGGGYAVA
jgi:hypothetical protein